MTAPQVVWLTDFREFASDRHIAKLMHDSDKCRVVLFCLEPGQELSPHESTSEVVFYGVEGKCQVQVGKDWLTLEPQTIAACPPNIPHGLKAATRTVVLAIITPRP